MQRKSRNKRWAPKYCWILIFLLFLNQEKKKLSNDNSVFPKTNYFSSLTFTVKYLLVFPIASIILFLSLYFIYKFDIFNIYHVSKMLHDQATLRNRTYHVWLFFNLYDFFLFLGIPDVILGTGDYFEYFHSNLVRTPAETLNYKLPTPYWIYLFIKIVCCGTKSG